MVCSVTLVIFTWFLVSCWLPEATAGALPWICAEPCALARLYFHLCWAPSALQMHCSSASSSSFYCWLWAWTPGGNGSDLSAQTSLFA